MRDIRILVAATVMAATAVAGLSGTADASYVNGSVVVPGHVAASTELTLLGSTQAHGAVAVRNGGAVLAADPGGTLQQHGVSVRPLPNGAMPLTGLSGDILSWAEPRPIGTHWVIHRVDVLGGGPTDFDSPDQPLAFTGGDGWIGSRGDRLVQHTSTIRPACIRWAVMRPSRNSSTSTPAPRRSPT